MSKIMVIGGTGTLGKQVTLRLLKLQYNVRVLSNESNPSVPEGSEFSYGDLGSGQGINEAMAGMDAIIHLATYVRNPQLIDVEGTQKLLKAALNQGSPHFIFMSIVGVDKSRFYYYKAKYDAERLVEKSGLPWTIQRSTQFHNFILGMLQSLDIDKLPEVKVPSGVRFQPIEIGEAADRLVSLLERGPSGRVTEIGGPQPLTIEEAAESYPAHQGHKIGDPLCAPQGRHVRCISNRRHT